MIVREVEYEVKGNVVIKPNIKEREERERKYREQEEQKRKRRELKKKISKRKAERRAVINKFIIGMFALGILIIGMQVYVYGLQRNVTEIKNQIKAVNEDSQSMRVSMLNQYSLNSIKTSAEDKYNMKIATKKDSVNIDLSQNYFVSLDAEDEKAENKKEDKSLLEKIMDVLN